jgi:hypothetical protein
VKRKIPGKTRKAKAPYAPKWLFWTPRIVSILFILFISLFALDIFDLKLGFWGTVLGLLMHLIPSIVLITILAVAWKREIVGAIAFILAGILYISQLFMKALMNPPPQWYMLSWSVIIAGPAILVGVLFWMNWRLKNGKPALWIR